MIIPDIEDPDYQDLIENEGCIMNVDTSDILNIVELE